MDSNNKKRELMELISQKDIDSRRRLIASLAEENREVLGEDFFAELLQNEEDSISKWYEIWALGKLTSKKYIMLLINTLKKPNVSFETGSSLHAITAFALGCIGKDSLSQVHELLKDNDVNVRLAAIDTIGEIASEDSLVELSAIFKEDYSKLTVYAGLALTKIGRPSIEFIKNIYSEKSESTKYILIDSLLGIDEEEAYAYLFELLKTDTDLVSRVINSGNRNSRSFIERILLQREDTHWYNDFKPYIK